MSGGYGDADERAMREYMATLPPAFHEYADDFAKLRLTSEMVKTFVGTAHRHQHEWWTDAVDDHVVGALEACMDKHVYTKAVVPGKEHVTHIRVYLDERQRAALKAEYASLTDLTFALPGRGDTADHPMAAAARVIANAQLRRMLPHNSRVLEVGAKVEHAIALGATPGMYMACVPVLDHHDAMRHSSADRCVSMMLRRRGTYSLKPHQRAVAQTYLRDFDSMFTRKTIQEVVWPTDVIMSLDANYDIPMSDMPNVMRRNGARVWFGSMVRCPQAAIYSGVAKGHLPMFGFDYVADAEADSITFHFRTSSRPYKHRLSIYREYMAFTQRVFKLGDSQYVYRMLPYTVPSQLFFAVYRVDDRPYPEDLRAFVPTGGAGMLKIDTVTAQLHGYQRDGIVPDSFEVTEDNFSRMLQDRMMMGKRVDDAEVIRMVRGARVGFVVNGVRLAADQPLAVKLLKPMAVVLNVLAFDMLDKGEKSAADAIHVIRRGGKRHYGIFGAACGVLWSTLVGSNSLVDLVRSRVQDLNINAKHGVNVTRMPAFKEISGAYVDLGDASRVVAPRVCLCAERAEVDAMLRGDRGGLCEAENTALELYRDELATLRCSTCVTDVARLDETHEDCFEDVRAACESNSSGSQTAVGGSDTSVQVSDTSSGDSSVESVSSDDSEGECGSSAPQYTVPPADGFVRDAVEEYVDICTQQMVAADSKARHWAAVLMRAGADEDTLEQSSDSRLSHHLLRVNAGVVVGILGRGVDPQSFNRVYDYDQKRFYDIRRVQGGQCILPRRCSSLVYTNSTYLIWNQPQLITFSRKVLADPRVGPVIKKLRFVNGVFGCGKTREIVAEYRTGDLYLSATRASVDRVRSELYGHHKNGKDCVRTFDSAAVHGIKGRKGGRIWMDEVPMAHAGQIFALMETLQPDVVTMYGDFFQIPYIAFLADYRMRYGSVRDTCRVEMRAITHRCRVSICAAVLQHYGEDSGLGVCKCCDHIQETEEAFEVHRITSLSQVPLEHGVKYLCFTQKEKDAVESALILAGISKTSVAVADQLSTNGASTVHEVQGGTFDYVYVVRLEEHTKPDSIYFSAHHVNTALTRVKFNCRYYTRSDEDDMMRQWYRNSQDERLRKIVRDNSN